MSRNIPRGGGIPQRVRGKKQGELKTIETGNKITLPVSVRIGANASNRPVARRSSGVSEPYRIQGKPSTEKRLSKLTLDKLLTWGQQEEQKCINMLRTLPAELPEYNEALEKLGKLQDVLQQVKRQLAVRK